MKLKFSVEFSACAWFGDKIKIMKKGTVSLKWFRLGIDSKDPWLQFALLDGETLRTVKVRVDEEND